MKNLKYIIAALFVVAVGAGIFWACQKEEVSSKTNNSNTSNTELHQKLYETEIISVDEMTQTWYHCWGELEVAKTFHYVVGGFLLIQKQPTEGDPMPPIIIIHFPLNTTTPGTLGEFTVSILTDNYSLDGLPTENTALYLDIMVSAFNN